MEKFIALNEESNIKTTGVLVLAPEVVKYQIEQQLAQIPEGEPRLLFPLPLDPRGASNLELRVVDHEFPNEPFSPLRELHILFSIPEGSDGVSVVNVIPDTDVLCAQYSRFFDKQVVYDLRRLDSRYLSKIPPGKEMMYITIRVPLKGAPKENYTITDVPFGHSIGNTRQTVMVFVGAADEVIPMDLKYLYMIDGVPVAIAANQ